VPDTDVLGGTALRTSEVEVQTLDALPATPTLEAPGPVSDTSEPQALTPLSEKSEVAQEPVAPIAPKTPVFKSAAQVSCEKKGGVFANVGRSGTFSCQTRTNDSGKACQSENDCSGSCLARSRSCAPLDPLFGCNEVLQADGRRVTLCID
jgi:hypothetical protein